MAHIYQITLTQEQLETVLTALYKAKYKVQGELGHTILINDALLAIRDFKVVSEARKPRKKIARKPS